MSHTRFGQNVPFHADQFDLNSMRRHQLHGHSLQLDWKAFDKTEIKVD